MKSPRNDTCDWRALLSASCSSKGLKKYPKFHMIYIIAKSAFFCTRLLLNTSKGQLMELFLPFILPYYGLASVINNNCHPLGKSILGLDTNQRTLNLKFRGLFFWRVASSRAAWLCAANVTFLSLFGLDFVKTTFKTIIGDLACGIFSFIQSMQSSVIQCNRYPRTLHLLYSLCWPLLVFIAGAMVSISYLTYLDLTIWNKFFSLL